MTAILMVIEVVILLVKSTNEYDNFCYIIVPNVIHEKNMSFIIPLWK